MASCSRASVFSIASRNTFQVISFRCSSPRTSAVSLAASSGLRAISCRPRLPLFQPPQPRLLLRPVHLRQPGQDGPNAIGAGLGAIRPRRRDQQQTRNGQHRSNDTHIRLFLFRPRRVGQAERSPTGRSNGSQLMVGPHSLVPPYFPTSFLSPFSHA